MAASSMQPNKPLERTGYAGRSAPIRYADRGGRGLGEEERER
jgi:hypothetical protein